MEEKKELDIDRLNLLYRIKQKDLLIFTKQLKILMNSSIGIIESLIIIEEETSNKLLKSIIKNIVNRLRQGEKLSGILRDYEKYFNEFYINMIIVGEKSGELESALDQIIIKLEQEMKLKNETIKNLMYPLILLITSTVVIIFIISFVIPVFIDIFEMNNVDIPVLTKFLLSITLIIKEYFIPVIFIFIICLFLFNKSIDEKRKKELKSKIILKIPILNNIYIQIKNINFFSCLTILQYSGVSLIESLEISRNIMNNTVLERKIDKSIEEIYKGISLSLSLENINIFSGMIITMIRIGEETGFLEDNLRNLVIILNNDFELMLNKIGILVEPIIIIIMAFFIGSIVISIALPMFDILTIL